MAYTCSHCLITSGSVLCPGCLQFLSDDLDVVEGSMAAAPYEGPGELDVKHRPVDWCTAFGHWGDVFVCCGHMLAYLRATRQAKCNVLYVGPDMAIVDWLREQPFVDEAFGIRITNADSYPAFWDISVREGVQPAEWLSVLEPLCGDLPAPWQVTQTHINKRWFHHVAAQMWRGGRLPERARGWAREQFTTRFARDTETQRNAERHLAQRRKDAKADLTQRHQGTKEGLGEGLIQNPKSKIQNGLVHLHPVSVWSESAENHWAHWRLAIYWLLVETPHTYVLTGQKKIPGLPRCDRLIDMIGETPGNMEMLAVSELCDAVISTPNNVAIWAAIQGQPALVVGNAATRHLSSYYTRFIMRGPGIRWLGVETGFEDWCEVAREWLGG